MIFRTRFAPSPTGQLHLGHAYSALLAHDMASAANGEFLLRIEDTDTARCRPEYETQIYADLHWLGIHWPSPVMRQSDRLADYNAAIQILANRGLCYPCACSRRDIREAISAPHGGNGANTYPGTCRHRSMASQTDTDAIRLDIAKALNAYPNIAQATFSDTGPEHAGTHGLTQTHLLGEIGDIVLARRDIKTASYHLAAVIDDAAQGINQIIRGEDLFQSTFIQIILQNLLGLPTPSYHHHALITDDAGMRLAKRTDAQSLETLRQNGATPQSIRQQLGL
ncbi:MAG: tRNA glutamyl-Q(34) synthetase GluQRS [Paracoccaceae bacterium]